MNLETVLGLSLTPTAVGWVLVEGRDADGAIVDHDQFEVCTGGGTRAASTSEQVAAAVLHAQSAAAERDQRVHLVGVTWSDAAAAEAALLLESFTESGLSNVVPIRSLDAAELLAGGIAPVVGYDRAAVCVLEGGSATVVMVDDSGDDTRTAVKHLSGGVDRLTEWLTAMYDRSKWQPDGVVVVADDGLDSLSGQLEETLPVPVFTQSGVPLAMARGAALAAAQRNEFTGEPMSSARTPVRSGAPSYAGALTVLAAGAATLVASVSLALGPRLLPDKPAQPVHHVIHRATPTAVAKAPASPPPKVETPPAQAAPEPAPSDAPAALAPVEPQSAAAPEPPAELPAAEPVPPPPPPPPPEPNPHPLLTKLLNRLHGVPDDPPPGEPPAP